MKRAFCKVDTTKVVSGRKSAEKNDRDYWSLSGSIVRNNSTQREG